MEWYIVCYFRRYPHRTLYNWDVITCTDDTRNENVRSCSHLLIRTALTCICNVVRTRVDLALEYTVYTGTTKKVKTTNNAVLTKELTTNGADLHCGRTRLVELTCHVVVQTRAKVVIDYAR